MQAKYHLGTLWFFARPKIAPDGTRYCEERNKASINPASSAFEYIVAESAELAEAIVERAQDGLKRADASDLLSDLRQGGFGEILPERLASRDDWGALPVFADVTRQSQAA